MAENLYEKYKPQINQALEEIKKLIKLYDEILAKNPKDSLADYRYSQLYIYLNHREKDLQDMPNRADEYEYFISEIKKYVEQAQNDYNKSYKNKVSFTATKEDAKKSLTDISEKLREIIKELRAFNNKYIQKGNHTNNYLAVKTMKEIEEKINFYDSELYKLEKTENPNYDAFIKKINEYLNSCKGIAKSIIRNQQYYGADKPNFLESQPGE